MRLAVFVLSLTIGFAGHAQSPREQLQQLAAELRRSPNDNALRERIIKLGAQLKPAPAIPEEARRHFVEGTVIVQAAKSPAQQALAAQSFAEALKVAPWWGDAYYNLGVAHELAGRYDEAEKALRLYLLSDPGEKERRDAQDRIYALSAKRKLAAVEAAANNAAHDWLQGNWRLSDELRMVQGGAFSPVAAVSVQSVKVGGALVFRRDGSKDFLRAISRDQSISWEHWKPVPGYKPVGCPEDGAWNRVSVKIAPDQRSISFSFHESHSGTCGRQAIHNYVLTRQ